MLVLFSFLFPILSVRKSQRCQTNFLMVLAGFHGKSVNLIEGMRKRAQHPVPVVWVLRPYRALPARRPGETPVCFY
jgi:hypothetical protein